MKIKIIDDLTFNIYLKKEEIKTLNMNNKDEIKKYLNFIINKLNKIYNLYIEGFYEVNVYIDKYYGIIIGFNKEKMEYYDYFNRVEMNINIKESSFLYMVEDIPINMLNKLEVKQINNNIYLKIIEELNQKEFMNLIEHTEKIIKL